MSRSTESAKKTLHAAFSLLKKNGSMPLKEILDYLGSNVQFTPWELEVYEKTGYVRWRSLFHFYSVDAVKAGLLVKSNGMWLLTPEGEKILSKGPDVLINACTEAYKDWARERRKSQGKGATPSKPADEEVEIDDTRVAQKAFLEQMDEKAREGIMEHIRKLNAYEFQDLSAALLRAMGYHTPMIAERGPDGGVDIIAYTDPLGMVPPRVKVQVKHKPGDQVPPADVRALIGVSNRQGEAGLFITSGRFSKDAMREARTSNTHCELIDVNRFVELWKEFYSKMPDDDRAMMPLHPVMFLGEVE